MSLKKFHIIFIMLTSFFMIYFAYWSILKLIDYNDLVYMFYLVLSIVSLILLLIYARNFISKYKGLIS